MSETKFTPGPWEASNGYLVAGKQRTIIAEYFRRPSPANATLIAAAPDMHAALVHVRKTLEVYHADTPLAADIIAIEAALAKAEGRS